MLLKRRFGERQLKSAKGLGATSLPLPRTRGKQFGGGLAAAFVTVFLLKKVYKRVQVGRNVKKVKIKREKLAARKRGLEERSPLHRVIPTFHKNILTQFAC